MTALGVRLAFVYKTDFSTLFGLELKITNDLSFLQDEYKLKI